MRYDIGVVGLTEEGRAIIRDLLAQGCKVSVYRFSGVDFDPETWAFVDAHPEGELRAGEDLVDFMVSLSAPRKIILCDDPIIDSDIALSRIEAVCTDGDIILSAIEYHRIQGLSIHKE
jgi:6-phosphogluconate dehydrogenase